MVLLFPLDGVCLVVTRKYLAELKLNKKQTEKLNKLRTLAEMPTI